MATGAERFGQIDVLVDNAGYGLFGAIEEISDAQARADPARAVAAIREPAAADQPPLRLHLGTDCVNFVEGKFATVAEELDEWRELALSTDLPSSWRSGARRIRPALTGANRRSCRARRCPPR